MINADQQELSTADEAGDEAAAAPEGGGRLSGAKLRIVVAAAVIVAVIGGVAAYLSRDVGPDSHDRLVEALELIDRRDDLDARSAAVDIARRLREEEYRDAEFSGGIEFILGIAAFRAANGRQAAPSDRNYLIAARELRSAERRAIESRHRPEWAFAFGSSLYEIGKATEARRLLEEAVQTYAPGRIESSTRLVDIYLDLKTEEALQQAIPLLESIVATEGLTQSQYDGAWLRSARVFLALNRQDKAEQALKKVSNENRGSQATIVFQAQTLMAEAEAGMEQARALSSRAAALAEQAQQAAQQKLTVEASRLEAEAESVSDQALLQRKNAETSYRNAMRQLEPVVADVGLEQTFPRQASFLLGLCAAAIDDVDAAINHFERTAEKYAGSHEAVAANLRAANLLRRIGRDEEALNRRYAAALQSVREPEDFRNRWLSLDEFRRQIRAAWDEWIADRHYREALTLAGWMTPLFPETESCELAARACQLWAEHIADRLRHATWSQRQSLVEQLHKRWRHSGKAHAELARVLETSSEYPTPLRISAEHYALGHDFESSLRQWNLYIETRPTARLAEALVNRGKVLLDLDRLDEALAEFQLVIDRFPKDAAAFEAQYVLGLCRLERNELERAEQAWRELITSESLTPAARQWQLALFSLGRLLYHTAAMKTIAADSPDSTLSDEETEALRNEAFVRREEAIRRLELFIAFVQRDPRHADAVDAVPEARYLLAKSLRKNALRPRKKLESAETENARLELRRTIEERLGQARDEYRTLQANLLAREEVDMLNEFEQQLLKDCFYELAHTYYALAGYGLGSPAEDYNKAIVAYSSAANKYSHDPQVILAYLQISRCYERLGQPVDARSAIEQAGILLKQLPDAAFAANTTNMTRQEWQEWLQWMRTLQSDATAQTAQTP